ncbi:hypothetical protein MLD52_10060, partial [Puniceicoccaceae bacterium K14]|nr:hypothetical protein [Puniceicoccaceae bacterium K14]
ANGFRNVVKCLADAKRQSTDRSRACSGDLLLLNVILPPIQPSIIRADKLSSPLPSSITDRPLNK